MKPKKAKKIPKKAASDNEAASLVHGNVTKMPKKKIPKKKLKKALNIDACEGDTSETIITTKAYHEERTGDKKISYTSHLYKLTAAEASQLMHNQCRLHEINLWDRLPYEGAKHFMYFNMYKDLGSTRQLSFLECEGASYETLKVWNRRYSWGERIAAYTEWRSTHLSENNEQVKERSIQLMHENHKRLNELNQQLLTDPEAYKKNRGIMQNLQLTGNDQTMRLANDTHKTLYGEKKMIASKSQISLNLSAEYGDSI